MDRPGIGLNCFYLSETDGIHDQRWLNALRSGGLEPMHLKVQQDAADIQRVVGVISAAPQVPVFLGPLRPMYAPIARVGNRVVGLSWGYDLAEQGRHLDDASWLLALDAVIVDCNASRDLLSTIGMSELQIHQMPWGIDLRVFDPDRFSPRLASSILTLRGHESMYHVTDVVHAFAQISSEFPGTQLVIGNDGSQTQSLKRLVQDLGMASRVDFIGRVDEDVLPSLLANARAYVTASEVDGTSVTLLQAMAMRCPVIASDITGNRQWTHGNRALSFPSGDVQGLAQCMADVLTGRTMPDIDAARQAVLAEADWFANIRRLPQIITG